MSRCLLDRTIQRREEAAADEIGVAEAKQRFSELIDRVERGERIVITRRGRPALALVPVERMDQGFGDTRIGALSMLGALADWDDLDDFIRFIYQDRRSMGTRPAPDLA